MYITTFYSFKGGVGRTMALVNAAVKLAQAGRRVLVVDFDIEAPGLDTFDVLKPRKEVPGIIDFVTQYLESNQSPDVSDFIGACPPIGEQGGKLYIMPSGRKETYAANFNQVDWGYLYERRDGFLLFEDLKAQWKQTIEPDYVLIDSRTGHTDTSGICTRQLPNAVVVLFFPNEQNLRGLVDVVSAIRAEGEGPRKKKIELHFVMSNIPDLDDEDRILESKIMAFQDQLGFRQEPMIVHRYDSLSLLNQVVFSKDRPKSRLAKEYGRIVGEIAVRNPDDRDGALEYIRRAEQPRKWIHDDSIPREQEMLDKEMLDKIKRAHAADGEVLFRLGVLEESDDDLESASSLYSKAIKVGYDKPGVYLKRSRLCEQNGNPGGASEDAWRMLNFGQVPPTMVREAISRLMRLETYDLRVVNSPAVSSLGPDAKVWIADSFDNSLNWARFTISLLEPILDVNELSESNLCYAKHCLGMSYMGLGRCSKAARMFRSEGVNIPAIDMEESFNYAMATWGATGTVQPEIFQRVIELDNTIPAVDKDLDPDYLQSMAIACWATGDDKAALDYVEQTQRVINHFGSQTAFSYWRYLRVDVSDFSEDMDEIRTLIKKPGSVMPKFMTVTGNGSA